MTLLSRFRIPIAAGAAGLFLVTMAASHSNANAAAVFSDDARTMVVTGYGSASAEPDQGAITLGVQSDAKTATAALADNNAKMAKLLKTLETAGVNKKHIQTSNFNIGPRYGKYDQTTGTSPILGYTVTNQVHVIVKDLDKFGKVLDAVVQDGANRINGISFTFSDPQPLMDEARTDAVKDAKRKAKLYAEAAGVTLGQIMTINEGYGGGTPQPVQARAMSEDMKAVPIAVGESELSASVSVTFEIK